MTKLDPEKEMRRSALALRECAERMRAEGDVKTADGLRRVALDNEMIADAIEAEKNRLAGLVESAFCEGHEAGEDGQTFTEAWPESESYRKLREACEDLRRETLALVVECDRRRPARRVPMFVKMLALGMLLASPWFTLQALGLIAYWQMLILTSLTGGLVGWYLSPTLERKDG